MPDRDGSRPFGSIARGDARLVDEEFFVSGSADAIAPDGRVLVRSLPYTTRAVVRRPAEPARFSGVAIVEPLHHIAETAFVLQLVDEWIVANGHAWIGVTVHNGTFTHAYGHPGGVPLLQRSDPARYQPLDLAVFDDPPPRRMQPGPAGFDPIHMQWTQGMGHVQGVGIVADLARLLTATRSPSPLSGLDVHHLVAAGMSQTGNFWRMFVDHGGHEAASRPDGTAAFAAYVILVAPVPEATPSDAIFVNVLSEAEVVATLNPRMMSVPDDNDAPRVRGYEITGAPHMIRGSTIPGTDRGDHAAQHTDEPFEFLVRAIFESLVTWLRDGTPMPSVPRIVREPRALDGLARDEHGNALGGLRAPWIEVPTAQYLARCTCSPTIGEKIPLDDETLAALYSDEDAYATAWRAAVNRLVEQRLLLPSDAAELSAGAAPSRAPAP